METMYEHAGGDEALHRLEEIFYEKVLEDPVLKTVFTERVPTHVDPSHLVHRRVVRGTRPLHP
jgi:hemoglobin